jgi:hypothetical protein
LLLGRQFLFLGKAHRSKAYNQYEQKDPFEHLVPSSDFVKQVVWFLYRSTF